MNRKKMEYQKGDIKKVTNPPNRIKLLLEEASRRRIGEGKWPGDDAG